MIFDLNNLADEVLSYSNDEFYRFIEDSLGFDEMLLIKTQAIKSSRSLINVPNVLAVLSLNCHELFDIKKRLCFITDENKFVVKSGIKAGIDDLVSLLKRKNDEYIRRTKGSKTSSQITSRHFISNSQPLTNTEQVATSNQQLVQSPNETTNTPINHDHLLINITIAIERFSVNTFSGIMLKNNIDYQIFLDSSDLIINGFIKCGCHVSTRIYFKPKTNSFQLSSYFKHLRESRCSMIKKKKQAIVVNQPNESLRDLSTNHRQSLEQSLQTEDIVDETDEESDDISESSSKTTNQSIVGKFCSKKRQTASSNMLTSSMRKRK